MPGRKRPRTSAILIHVVEDHNDALPAIHSAMKKKLLPFDTKFPIVHFDSHPDLSPSPSIPAALSFCPRELYEALDESIGGIAEWLLPLFYAGHLSSCVWVKRRWCGQFVGSHSALREFFVGEEKDSGLLKVTSKEGYYIEDGGFTDPTKLNNPQRVRLLVKNADNQQQIEQQIDLECDFGQNYDYVLDVCLDYFFCNNPFIVEIEKRFGRALAMAVYEAAISPNYRKIVGDLEDVGVAEAFFAAFRDCLESESEFEVGQIRLIEFYAETSGPKIVGKMMQEFASLPLEIRGKAFAEVLEAVEVLALPHSSYYKNSIFNLNEERVLFKSVLNGLKLSHPPSVVTIARSTEDDFTPKVAVEELQQMVISVIRDTFKISTFDIVNDTT